AQGFCDIGLNGSYLVVRELRQDVPAFWQSMDRAAQTIRDADPEASEITGEWLAEKVVGRTKEGHVLTPKGPHKPDAQDRPENDFLFYETDAHGTGCPLGSHIRRAHPRDSLAPKPELTETLLKAANNHRILRRGRKYGPKIADARVDDGQDRGLLFMCLNTDIARQFEFVQQTWLLNSDFETLFEEVDPLIGADGGMTVPEDGLRRRVHVQTFVHMMGGEYFFLPSLPTLTYLARL
ncbi:MAG: peroxidase, partial [Pseudomonadota bacterium]